MSFFKRHSFSSFCRCNQQIGLSNQECGDLQHIHIFCSQSRVPILEYPMLARAVYYTSREGQEVRDDLYVAIATVLAFVFNLNAAAGGIAQPPIEVPETARFDEHGIKIERKIP